MSRTSLCVALLASVLGCATLLAWSWMSRSAGAGGKGPAVPPRAERPPIDVEAPKRTETATFALG
jgi:hypothetical protein